MTVPQATPERPGHRVVGEFDRRTLIISAVLLFGVIALGVGAIALFSDPGPPSPAQGSQATPRIIEQPNTGSAPENPGDRGGWEQLALMGLVLASLVGIGVVIARGGGAKAKANRDAWKAAAATGEDGAVPR